MEKKKINYMTIEIPSKKENREIVYNAINNLISQRNPEIDVLTEIRSAVNEALTNAIIHAYKDETGKISINVDVYEDEVEIKIRDWGCGIEDIERAKMPLFTTGGDKCTGLGFEIMKSFMDTVEVFSKVGEGTTVTMKRHVNSTHSVFEGLFVEK